MREKILVTKSSMPPMEEYIDEIKDLWDSHWLTNMGEKHNELQQKLEEIFEVRHVVLFTNGHLALEGTIEAMNLPEGGEIITTPFTFASTTHAIVRKGFKPVFCDINDDDYTIDVNKIEELITDKTVAVMPVHVYGNICDVDRIKEIADKHNLKILYDAAHAFNVRYNDRSVAGFGDASMFSFHATKVFNTIEGGAICTNDDELCERLNEVRNYGIKGPESCVYPGGNAKMNEFQAAMGLCNLRHLDEEISKRKAVVEKYFVELGNIEGIKLNHQQKSITPNYSYFPVVFDDYKYSRDEVYERLEKNNIIARKYFYPLTNEFGCYKNQKESNTPIAGHIADRVLTLPLYADLPLDMVTAICNIIKD